MTTAPPFANIQFCDEKGNLTIAAVQLLQQLWSLAQGGGTVIGPDTTFVGLQQAWNDATAATAGVGVDEPYLNGSVLQVRQS